MLGKLKEMAGNSAVQKIVDQVTPLLNEQLEKIKTLSPEKINDNEFFDKAISKPAWLAIMASLGGLTKLYPPLEAKFPLMMRHLRDELVVVDGASIALVEGFQAKLPKVIMDGLRS